MITRDMLSGRRGGGKKGDKRAAENGTKPEKTMVQRMFGGGGRGGGLGEAPVFP